VLACWLALSLGLLAHAGEAPAQPTAAPRAKAPPAANRSAAAPTASGQPAGADTTAAPAKPPATAEVPAGEKAEQPAPPLPVQAPTEEAPAAPVIIEYDELEVDEQTERAQRKQKIPVLRMLKNNKFAPGQQQMFDTYYKEYALKRWGDKDYRHQLPKFRAELANELKTGKSGLVHDYLLELAMPFLLDLAKKNYHPAVRYNAMLMIGDLNAVDSMTVREPTVPYPDALPVLLEAVADENQIDAVKVAALLGIVRHAALGGIDPQLRNQVVDVMLQQATTKAVAGRSAEGQAWIRAIAIEGLAALRGTNAEARIANALADIVVEKETPFLTRCAAARALGKLDYQAAVGVDPVQLATRLGQLAADACQNELDAELPDLGNRAAARTAGGYGYGGGGYDEGDEYDEDDSDMGGSFGFRGPVAMTPVEQAELQAKEYQAPIFRRRLKSRLQAVWEGLCGNDVKMSYVRWRPEGGEAPTTGIYAAADPAHEAFMKNLLATLKELMAVCDEKKEKEEEEVKSQTAYDALVAQVQEQLSALNQLLGGGPTPGEPDEAAGAAGQ